MEEQTVLVTGSSGFIGRYLVKRLRAMGHQVIPFDIVDGKDFCNPGQVETVFLDFNVDAVCHLGAQAYIGPAEKDPIANASINILGTINLLEHCYRNGARIIYHSTGAVYSDECPQPVNENSPTEPKSHYGVSKLGAEEYVRMYQRRGLHCLITRFSSVYGVGRDAAPVNIFTKKAVNDEEITIFGPDITRDYTHVSDVVKGVTGLLFHEQVLWNAQTFNIASGVETRTIHVVHLLEELMQKQLMKTIMPSKKGDVMQNYFDISKMESLGYEPEVGLEEGLKELLHHYETEL